MIRLLRKIRQQLISEKNYGIYLLYAAGEILLVIMGILLALQIDGWNERKKDKSEEMKILYAFHEEFVHNKDDLIANITSSNEINSSCLLLLDLIGTNPGYLKQFNIDSIIGVAIVSFDYLPSEYVLADLLSTGKLELISSEKLRMLLFKWSHEMQQKEKAFAMLDKYFMESLLPYLNHNASIKNIDANIALGSMEPSVLVNNTVNMFQQIEKIFLQEILDS